MQQKTLEEGPLAVIGAGPVWCTAYAQDVDAARGLVFASFVSHTKRDAQAVLDSILGDGDGVRLANKVRLKRMGDVTIPWHGQVGLLDPEAKKRGSVRYRAVYTTQGPHLIRTGVGYEACIVTHDATLRGVQTNHWAYALRWPGDEETVFRQRFLWLWSDATALPRQKHGWFGTLWRLGLSLGLIAPLQTHRCQGWRIDPRGVRPGDKPAWEQVLHLAVTMGAEIGGDE